jgi:phosphomannomutase
MRVVYNLSMINRSIFKAYDVRGKYPKDVNSEAVTAIAGALARLFPSGTLVVARDGRHGSQELSECAAQALKEEGERLGKEFDVIHAGLATTPMFYFLVNHLNAEGGMMITASHNPKEYNGVKTVKKNAEAISGTELLTLLNNE